MTSVLMTSLILLVAPMTCLADDASDREPILPTSSAYSCSISVIHQGLDIHYHTRSVALVAHSFFPESFPTAMYRFGEFAPKTATDRRTLRRIPRNIQELRFGVRRRLDASNRTDLTEVQIQNGSQTVFSDNYPNTPNNDVGANAFFTFDGFDLAFFCQEMH